MATRDRIPELSGIEFTGHQSVQQYSSVLRALLRDIGSEVEFGAEELYAVLSRQQGHPLLMGIDVRLRARKVAMRLRRTEELVNGAAVESVKFYREFRIQFQDVIEPKRDRNGAGKPFDFNDH